jgi:hypothetical protein
MLPPLAFPEGEHTWGKVGRGLLRDFLTDTPVTMEAMRQASALPIDFAAPIYDSLLMDAMTAVVRHEYRTAILYAAIAVETVSRTVCEQEHQRLFNVVPMSDTVTMTSLTA